MKDIVAGKPKVAKNDYVVEKIDGVKMEDGELQFFVKWEGYPLSDSSFEPYKHVKDCIAFQHYIDNFRSHLKHEIALNGQRMRSQLGDKIRAIMTNKPKPEIIEDLAMLEKYGYDAYEVLYHILPPNNTFYALFEELFKLNFIAELLDNQINQFRNFELAVTGDEFMTLKVENAIDFSVFAPFTYITENRWMRDPLVIYNGCVFELPDVEGTMKLMQPYKQPLTLFKTNNQGWGVKAMTKIPVGRIVFECLGEVLPLEAAIALTDKKYLFPVPIVAGNQTFMVNAANYGNLSRFVNHRCYPNCRLSRFTSTKDLLKNKLVMHNIRDIAAGEEITIDYTKDCALIKYGIDCLCDSGRCYDKF